MRRRRLRLARRVKVRKRIVELRHVALVVPLHAQVPLPPRTRSHALPVLVLVPHPHPNPVAHAGVHVARGRPGRRRVLRPSVLLLLPGRGVVRAGLGIVRGVVVVRVLATRRAGAEGVRGRAGDVGGGGGVEDLVVVREGDHGEEYRDD